LNSVLHIEWAEVQKDALAWILEKKKEATLRSGSGRILQFIGPVYDAFRAHITSEIFQGASKPTFVELALAPDFLPLSQRALLDQHLPDDQEVIDNAISKIPDAVAEWQETWDNGLLNIMSESPAYSGQVITREILPYASTLFHCLECGTLLTYRNVLPHRCYRAWRVFGPSKIAGGNSRNKKKAAPVPEPNDSDEVSVEDMVWEAYSTVGPGASWYNPSLWTRLPRSTGPKGSGPWPVKFHTAAHYHMLSLLDALGMERTTTSVTMSNLNPNVKCLCRCYTSPKGGRPTGNGPVMQWHRAVST
jgi:hypothetical protein